MKYCPECGKELKSKNEASEIKKSKKKNPYLMAAGIMVLIAASMCIFVAIFGAIEFSEGEYRHYPTCWDDCSERIFLPQHLLTSMFGVSAFIFGMISGISVLSKKLFSLSIVGNMLIMTAAISLILLSTVHLILLGLPILVLAIISLSFTCFKRKDFSN
jgi:hypothetical protein